jgi:hypothetical protein
MKAIALLYITLLPVFFLSQQQSQLAHGTIFGTKPSMVSMVDATKVEAYMGKKVRISTTIRGKVIRVTKPKEGWFEIDAGNGKVIDAHFRLYNITLPLDLKGRYIIAEGIAQKQFIADDMQHMAGDTATGKKQHNIKTNPKQRLTFEVKGLMVDK